MRFLNNNSFKAGFLAAFFSGMLLAARASLSAQRIPLESSLLVVAFFNRELPDDQARLIAVALPQRDPEIIHAQFVSKEEAFQSAQQRASFSRAMVLLKKNPFPSSVELRYRPRAWRDRNDPSSGLKDIPEIVEVRWSVPMRDAWKALDSWERCVREALAGLGAVLVLFAGFSAVQAFKTQPGLRPLGEAVWRGAAGALLSAAFVAAWIRRAGVLPQGIEWAYAVLLLILMGGLAGTAFFGYKTQDEP